MRVNTNYSRHMISIAYVCRDEKSAFLRGRDANGRVHLEPSDLKMFAVAYNFLGRISRGNRINANEPHNWTL